MRNSQLIFGVLIIFIIVQSCSKHSTGRKYPPDLAAKIKDAINSDEEINSLRIQVLDNIKEFESKIASQHLLNEAFTNEITDLLRKNEEVMNVGPKDAIYDQLRVIRKLNDTLTSCTNKISHDYKSISKLDDELYNRQLDSLITFEINSLSSKKRIDSKEHTGLINNIKYRLTELLKSHTEKLIPISHEYEVIYNDDVSLILKLRIAQGNYELNTIDVIELSNNQYFDTGSDELKSQSLSKLDSAIDKYYLSIITRITQLNNYMDSSLIKSSWHLEFFCTGYTDTQGFSDSGRIKYTAYCNHYKIPVPGDSILRRKLFNEILSQQRANNTSDYLFKRFYSNLNSHPDHSLRSKIRISAKPNNIKGLGEMYPDASRVIEYIKVETENSGNDQSRRKTYFQGVFNAEAIRK